jgi:hypothetical protein
MLATRKTASYAAILILMKMQMKRNSQSDASISIFTFKSFWKKKSLDAVDDEVVKHQVILRFRSSPRSAFPKKV